MPSTPSEEAEAQLQLVQGPHRPRHTIASTLHIVLSTTAVLLRIPFHLLYHYVFIRHRSPFVQDLGRSPFVEAGHILVRHLFLHCYLPPSRPVFRLGFPSKWVKDVDFAGVRASWIAPPDRPDRTEDEIVLFWLNGGGFVHDVGGMSRLAYVKLAKMVNKRDVKFSIFHLHYRLAPEYIYPSQLIETLAAYKYLVNVVGIPESKICIRGDSAGANLVTAFLLHLARPNPRIQVEVFDQIPAKPASALLITPFIDLVSTAPSRSPALHTDIIDDGGVFHGALSYVGATHALPADLEGWKYAPSWNPLDWFAGRPSCDSPPPAFVEAVLAVDKPEEEREGTELFGSPYVNPNPRVVKDLSWYKEALPGNGRTLVSWGGQEIFADDIVTFVEALRQAGVNPSELVKPLASHDWALFDAIVPFASRDKNGGEQARPDWGLGKIADFLAAQVKAE
ncbi:Esterase [Rhodotorula toruloides]|nr:Esterase [Rhodotorula toruloides]